MSALRRFLPLRGTSLTLANVRGPWRPTAAVDGAGVFAILWSTGRCDFWAPLHDFNPVDQLRLVEACRHLDQGRGFEGAWPKGRT